MFLSSASKGIFLSREFFPRSRYLGCHVIRRAAERIGGSVEENLQLAHAKIGYSDMPFVI